MTNATTIGELAIKEHATWIERNAARKAFHSWLKKYCSDTGEHFDREVAEAEDVAEFDPLKKAAKTTQRALTAARATTRRAIARYHRDSPEAMEAKGQERLL